MSYNSSETVNLEPTQGLIRRHCTEKVGGERDVGEEVPTGVQHRKVMMLSFSFPSPGSAATWERYGP